MSAMRHLRQEITINFKPKKAFRVRIPPGMLEEEPERQKVISLWRSFHSTACALCESRYSIWMDKRYRRAVFKGQMDKLCKDFSRRTENIKVIFEVKPRPDNPRKEHYYLKFLQLTDIPDYCRNAPSCPAEIPPTELQVFGDFVSNRYDTGLRVVVEQISGQVATEVPSAPIEILDPPEQTVPIVYVSESSEDSFNPPLATAVLATPYCVSMDEDEPVPVVFATARLDGDSSLSAVLAVREQADPVPGVYVTHARHAIE